MAQKKFEPAKYLANERDKRQSYFSASRNGCTVTLLSAQKVSKSKSLQDLTPKCSYCYGGNLSLVRFFVTGVPYEVTMFGKPRMELRNEYHCKFLCEKHLARIREYARTRKEFQWPDWGDILK